ncbi:gamma-glutamylcyclotransferase family protein [Arsukibacterium sp.]|uniref:gamma-glutamylcyclotransferase family protein n=1 Tax=Arsukibacterium sp. TaxID=1977258 RepID=UPI00299D57B9|nr:gamma-glutamylcyclotransferase family protein [Arsukibacterium sp.]MDX1678142.1 gamma-glutamylcyclotransferase family protein [Arsukibacterium sp.]
MKYFAYGSNMALARIKQRIPGALRHGVVSLAQHTLRFHKVGYLDGSAKCDAFFTGREADQVIGMLYNISDSDKSILDKIEGVGFGYQDKEVQVTDSQGNRITALTYIATHIDSSLRPFNWYLNHVLRGATECGLPGSYIAAIAATPAIDDPDKARDASERAVYPAP